MYIITSPLPLAPPSPCLRVRCDRLDKDALLSLGALPSLHTLYVGGAEACTREFLKVWGRSAFVF
jgi:hypothetical protein